jgi:hypothetical protein
MGPALELHSAICSQIWDIGNLPGRIICTGIAYNVSKITTLWLFQVVLFGSNPDGRSPAKPLLNEHALLSQACTSWAVILNLERYSSSMTAQEFLSRF